MSRENCRYCGNVIAGDECIILWDGNRYCYACVESQSTKLAEYATTHKCLEEHAPNILGRVVRMYLILEGAIFITFLAFFTVLFGWPKGFTLTLIILSIQSLIQLPAFIWVVIRGTPIVIAKDGWIECYRYSKERLPQFRVPLHTIEWRVDKAIRDSWWKFTLIKDEVLILRVTEQSSKLFPRVEFFAFGWTAESKELWKAFFFLAGIYPSGAHGQLDEPNRMVRPYR